MATCEYLFKLGKRFNVEIKEAAKDGMICFAIQDILENPLIHIGTFVKTDDNFIQNMDIESILDNIPSANYKIMLQKMDEED
jgi:hypothetical protein